MGLRWELLKDLDEYGGDVCGIVGLDGEGSGVALRGVDFVSNLLQRIGTSGNQGDAVAVFREQTSAFNIALVDTDNGEQHVETYAVDPPVPEPFPTPATTMRGLSSDIAVSWIEVEGLREEWFVIGSEHPCAMLYTQRFLQNRSENGQDRSAQERS